MRSKSFDDTTVLLSTVSFLGLVLLLSLPEFLSFLSNRLAEIWWVLRQIF